MKPAQDYVTLRNDRFVIPVRAAERRAVPGVVHGASATGQTVFVEPLETIELNNRLVQLGEEEAAEIARILADLTDQLAPRQRSARPLPRAIAELDSRFRTRAVRPRIRRRHAGIHRRNHDSRSNRAPSRSRRHAAAAGPRRRSACTLALGGEETPSWSSAARTPAAKRSRSRRSASPRSPRNREFPSPPSARELPIFDRVLADIGDEQSIAADLSTFSAHMLNLKSMLERATQRIARARRRNGHGHRARRRRRAGRRAPR